MFAAPFAFLLLLPLAFAAWRLFRASPRRRGIPFAATSWIPRRVSLRQRLRVLAPVSFLLGGLLLVVAAARPQTRTRLHHSETDAIAISMILDVSGSMRQPDMEPKAALPSEKTRLDVAKEAFSAFVERRPDDLIGLVTFGLHAATRTPLTLDHAALTELIKGIEITDNEEASQTALGDGLATGCARLEQATNVVSHIAVLLTDGQNNSGTPPEEAAAAAKALGIKVYTIGIGNRVPIRGVFGIMGYDEGVDSKTLTYISEQTGGRFFRARDTEALDRAMEEIDALERSAVNELVFENRTEHFAPFLVSGAALLLLSALLSIALERRIA